MVSSKRGALFKHLKIAADLRCEDVSFDVVHSASVIEHFDDPSEISRIHVELLKPGGVALITVPHFGGVYGHLARYFCPDLLSLHNLGIMSVGALRRLAPTHLVSHVEAYPSVLASTLTCFVEGFAWLQPLSVGPLCPSLVLRMTRTPE